MIGLFKFNTLIFEKGMEIVPLLNEIIPNEELLQDELFVECYVSAMKIITQAYSDGKDQHDTIFEILHQSCISYKRAFLFSTKCELFYQHSPDYHSILSSGNHFLIDYDIDFYQFFTLDTENLEGMIGMLREKQELYEAGKSQGLDQHDALFTLNEGYAADKSPIAQQIWKKIAGGETQFFDDEEDEDEENHNMQNIPMADSL